MATRTGLILPYPPDPLAGNRSTPFLHMMRRNGLGCRVSSALSVAAVSPASLAHVPGWVSRLAAGSGFTNGFARLLPAPYPRATAFFLPQFSAAGLLFGWVRVSQRLAWARANPMLTPAPGRSDTARIGPRLCAGDQSSTSTQAVRKASEYPLNHRVTEEGIRDLDLRILDKSTRPNREGVLPGGIGSDLLRVGACFFSAMTPNSRPTCVSHLMAPSKYLSLRQGRHDTSGKKR